MDGVTQAMDATRGVAQHADQDQACIEVVLKNAKDGERLKALLEGDEEAARHFLLSTVRVLGAGEKPAAGEQCRRVRGRIGDNPCVRSVGIRHISGGEKYKVVKKASIGWGVGPETTLYRCSVEKRYCAKAWVECKIESKMIPPIRRWLADLLLDEHSKKATSLFSAEISSGADGGHPLATVLVRVEKDAGP